jgi:uncharacterized protein YggT (Ycf19 family)
MIVFPLQVCVLPLLVAHWLISSCLLVLLLRLILPRLVGPAPARWHAFVRQVSDPLFNLMHRAYGDPQYPRFSRVFSWLLLFGVLLVVQKVLAWFLVALL